MADYAELNQVIEALTAEGRERMSARLANVPRERIMLSGIGKTQTELALAIDEGILCINVESEPELELLSRLATETGKTARISVGVNPDVDAKTHYKIATGKAENKFGIPISRAREVYAHAAKLAGVWEAPVGGYPVATPGKERMRAATSSAPGASTSSSTR